MLNIVSLILLVAATIGAVFFVPDSPFNHMAEPVYQTIPSLVVSTLLILAIRAAGPRVARVEQWIFAIFLGSMPMVYVTSWLRTGHGSWIWIELAGLAIFASLAILGMKVSPWFLALGIIGHGLLWDLWHHGRSEYVPTWYADACLLVDVGFGIYAAMQIPRWRALRSTTAGKLCRQE